MCCSNNVCGCGCGGEGEGEGAGEQHFKQPICHHHVEVSQSGTVTPLCTRSTDADEQDEFDEGFKKGGLITAAACVMHR